MNRNYVWNSDRSSMFWCPLGFENVWCFHSNRLRHLHTYYLLVKRRRNPSITYSTVEIFLVRISVSIMASNAVMFISQVDTFRMTCLTINGNFCSIILSPVPISLIWWATSTPNEATCEKKVKTDALSVRFWYEILLDFNEKISRSERVEP